VIVRGQRINMFMFMFINMFMFRGVISVLPLACSITAGALVSPGLLLSYSIITLPLHIPLY